jgi:hypothetical protein
LAAPTAGASLLGLDTNGNWVWAVNASPDATLFTGSPAQGSVAIEIGAASDRTLVSAGKNAVNFPNDNPGTPIGAGFPTLTNTTALGVQVLGNNTAINLGSDLFTAGGAKEAARIHVQGPTNVAGSTTLTLSGAYSGNGRIAQAGVNNDTVTGANVGTVLAGNAKLEAVIGGASFALLLASFESTPGPGGHHWQQGDFNGDGHTNGSDFAIMLSNYGKTDPYWSTHTGSITLGTTPGAGAGSASAVPEPASIALLAIGGLFAALRIRRGR